MHTVKMFIRGLFVLFVCIASTEGNLFRGGLITWRPIGNKTIEINYRVSWRRSNFFEVCDDALVSSGNVTTGEGSLICIFCTVTTILPTMDYKCTDFSETEDWTTGVGSVTLDASNELNTFHVGFQGGNWITLQEGGGGWSVISLINITERHGKGVSKINSSPITAMQPITRLQSECSYTIKIPVNDVDGDVVRCRWAGLSQLAVDECSGVCKRLSGSNLTEETCELSYSPINNGYYAVAIQIEDYLSTGDRVPLSSVPLQFLILVSTQTSPCSGGPSFTENTIANGAIIYLGHSSNFELQIVTKTSLNNISIAEIITVSPANMIKGHLSSYGTSGNAWSVNVSWTPSPSQVGDHIFCFSAVDTNGLSTEQRCVTIIVYDEIFSTHLTTKNQASGSCTSRRHLFRVEVNTYLNLENLQGI